MSISVSDIEKLKSRISEMDADHQELLCKALICGHPGCGKNGWKEFSCKGCGELVYCDEDCRKQHWTDGHKGECTKLDELERLQRRAADANDKATADKMLDACVKALGKYFSNRLRSSNGDPVRISTFIEHVQFITVVVEQGPKLEEHLGILFEVLDEAERLLEEGKVFAFDTTSSEITTVIREQRAMLYSKKGRIYLSEGDLGTSSAMFERAVSIAREIQVDDPDRGQYVLAANESTKAFGYLALGDHDQAIRYYEEAYVLMGEKFSPDDRQLQDITRQLGLLYQEKGDLEKAEQFAREALGNLEKYYNGKLRCEVAVAQRNLAACIFQQFRRVENTAGERREELMVEYESLLRKALINFKNHDDESSRLPIYAKQASRDTYHEALPYLIRFCILYDRGESSELQELINEHIQYRLKLTDFRVSTYPDQNSSTAGLFEAFCFIFDHLEYRQRFGTPLSKDERKSLASRKTEYQQILGLPTKKMFDMWYDEAVIKKVVDSHTALLH